MGDQQKAQAMLPLGMARYTLCRRLGVHQNHTRGVHEMPPLSGFDPRTVLHVVRRYADSDIDFQT